VENTNTLLKTSIIDGEPAEGGRGNPPFVIARLSVRKAVAISKRDRLRQHILQPFGLENEIGFAIARNDNEPVCHCWRG